MLGRNPQERREFAQFVNDLGLDFMQRLADERARHEQEERLLRGTIDRLREENRELLRGKTDP